MGRPHTTAPGYERFDVEGAAAGVEAGAYDGHGDHGGGPNWKGDLCQCCGDGVDVRSDVRLCLQALVCPCIIYGQTMRRALLVSGSLHCLLFFVCVELFWIVGSTLRGRCGTDPTPAYLKAPPAPLDADPPPPPPPEKNALEFGKCINKANYATLFLFFLTCLFVLYSAVRRYQLRLKFGFPNASWRAPAHDLFAWACCTLCVVCQEARTMRYNNVEDGIWHGPQITLRGQDIAGEIAAAQAAAVERGRGVLGARRTGYTLYAGFGGGLSGLDPEGAGWEAPSAGMVRQETDSSGEEEAEAEAEAEEEEREETFLLARTAEERAAGQ